MALEKQFTLEAVEKPKNNQPTSQRRQKFIAAVEKQLAGMAGASGGAVGSSWIWKSDKGEWFISPRYGKGALELAPGMASIKCTDAKDVIENLNKLKALTAEGKLDDALEAAASAIRSRFGK